MTQKTTNERLIEIASSAAWQRAAKAILAGIRHDLNGRIGTVSGLVQLARLDGALDDETGDTLESELVRMEHLSNLIEAAFLDRDRPAEPIVLSDLLTQSVELVRRHRGLESATFELDIADEVAVAAPRPPLLRALVVLVAGAMHRQPRVRLDVRRAGGHAVVRIGPIGQASPAVADAASPDDEIPAARSVVESLGGTLEVVSVDGIGTSASSEGDIVVLRVPVLEPNGPT